jgi:hypothetical protein
MFGLTLCVIEQNGQGLVNMSELGPGLGGEGGATTTLFKSA